MYITLDLSSKKVVNLSPGGWLKFRDVRLSGNDSKCLISYSAKEEGSLVVYSDPSLQNKIGEALFGNTADGDLELTIQADSVRSLYFTTTNNVSLRTIKEK